VYENAEVDGFTEKDIVWQNSVEGPESCFLTVCERLFGENSEDAYRFYARYKAPFHVKPKAQIWTCLPYNDPFREVTPHQTEKCLWFADPAGGKVLKMDKRFENLTQFTIERCETQPSESKVFYRVVDISEDDSRFLVMVSDGLFRIHSGLTGEMLDTIKTEGETRVQFLDSAAYMLLSQKVDGRVVSFIEIGKKKQYLQLEVPSSVRVGAVRHTGYFYYLGPDELVIYNKDGTKCKSCKLHPEEEVVDINFSHALAPETNFPVGVYALVHTKGEFKTRVVELRLADFQAQLPRNSFLFK